jgi:flagellar M-ring protein FliF
MEFLIRAYLQIFQLYRAMSPGSRVTSGLLTALAVLGGGYLYLHQNTTPEVDLMQGIPMTASQLPAMQAAFAKANLKSYAVRGTSILVPRGQEADYMAALALANALPSRPGGAQHEAINSTNPFEFGSLHDQRMKIAKQEELAHGICQIPGIESAYVLYDVDNRPGPFEKKIITAAAMIKPSEGKRLDESLVLAIREMVAGAIAGLKVENVAVTDLASGRTWHGVLENNAVGNDDLYLSLKHNYEQDLKAKVLNALSYIPNVSVATNVELVREQAKPKTLKEPIPETREAIAPLPEGDRTTPATFSQPSNAAAMALKSLLDNHIPNADAPKNAASKAPASDVVEKDGNLLSPKLARVSVGVPASYFRQIWQQRYSSESGKSAPSPSQAVLDKITAEESVKIQRLIAPLLPITECSAKAIESVTVTPFQDIATPVSVWDEIQNEALNWLRDSWQIVAGVIAVFLGLFALRWLTRPRAKEADLQAEVADEPVPAMEEANEIMPSVVPTPHARRFHSQSSSVREDLSEMVEEDPDAAANVLRSWIGQVG